MTSQSSFQAKNWQKALELYEDLKSTKLRPTVSTVNALINALCMSLFCYVLLSII